MESNICNFCTKEFSSKVNLILHQKTVKTCLKLQGKEEKDANIQCENCKKVLAVRSYKQHKLKCDLSQQKEDLIKHNKDLLFLVDKYKSDIIYLEKENEKLKYAKELLEKQVENLHSMSTSVTMKLAENFLENL